MRKLRVFVPKHSQALRIALEMQATNEKDAKNAIWQGAIRPRLTYSIQNAYEERKRNEK